MSQDVRWHQRLENFEKAFALLDRTILIQSPSEAERGGLIQFYKMAFELSWKVMKDYLESLGFEINSPRQSIKQAFQSGLITDGHLWIEALTDRNLTVHTYDENKAKQVELSIRESYHPMLKTFITRLRLESHDL